MENPALNAQGFIANLPKANGQKKAKKNYTSWETADLPAGWSKKFSIGSKAIHHGA